MPSVVTGGDKDGIEMTNTVTGVVRRIPFCSDKQFEYLNTLRARLNKDPLKNKPFAYEASKKIEKLKQQLAQQRLF